MKRIVCLFLLIFYSLIFMTCGGDGGENASLSALEGVAVKGQVVGAEVRVYYFDSTGGEVQIDAANAPVITGSDGSFRLELGTLDMEGIGSPIVLRTIGGTMGPAVGNTLFTAPTLEGVIADPFPLAHRDITLVTNLTLASSVAAGLVRKQAGESGAPPTAADVSAWIELVEDQLDLDLTGDPGKGDSGICQANICADQNLGLENHPENNAAVDDLIAYLVANLASSSNRLDGFIDSPDDPGLDATADFSSIGSGLLAAILGSDPAGYVNLKFISDKAFINNDGSDTATLTALLFDACGNPVVDLSDIQFSLLSGHGSLGDLTRDQEAGSVRVLFTSRYHGEALIEVRYRAVNGNLLTQQLNLDVVDLVTDTDGDGFADGMEEMGWTVIIDEFGYGASSGEAFMTIRRVASDPEVSDTDGDGLDDYYEYLIRTDPTAADTDGDGLTDKEEWNRWTTNPLSVDTDGDSRGREHIMTPNSSLFDGNELTIHGTSPSLEDTDGDGKTDYEELFELFRSPLLADLPRLEIEIVDKVDIRLNVEYAEEEGQERQYGAELSRSRSESISRYNENSMQFVASLGGETEFGYEGGSGKIVQHVNYSFSGGYGHVWSSTRESSEETQRSYSDYTTDSRTRTETASSGSMSTGIRLKNAGNITYSLMQLGITVRKWQPGSGSDDEGPCGSFKTLATLTPALSGGITLAPGAETPVLQVGAADLSASLVKEFLARPDSLYLEAASYELENAEGLNFAFLEEVTVPRTGRLLIDFGDGQSEAYLVATSVRRMPDGTPAGATLGYILTDLLGIPFETTARKALNPASPTNEQVLTSMRGHSAYGSTSGPRGFWTVAMPGDLPPGINFQDLTLNRQEQIIIVFVEDRDGDNLYSPEEHHYRTDDLTEQDTDGDGLNDAEEIRGGIFIDDQDNEIPCGWVVTTGGRTYPVWSDPASTDQDGDGWNDLRERDEGTDPTLPDTDRDGITDSRDHWPLNPARVLKVMSDAPDGGDGSTWQSPLNSLQLALATARAGFASTLDANDDVSEIWVASGHYKPSVAGTTSLSFEMVDTVGIYGGFAGSETLLSQRNSDPLTNGCLLTGDLDDDDTQDFMNMADNSHHVVKGVLVGPSSVLDGFTITGGNAVADTSYGDYDGGGIQLTVASPTLRNLFLYGNSAEYGGGAVATVGGSDVTISDSFFFNNKAQSGGAVFLHWVGGGWEGPGDPPLGYGMTSTVHLTNCNFRQNTGNHSGAAGGTSDESFLEGCSFFENQATDGDGGAVGIWGPMKVTDCFFSGNSATRGGGAIDLFSEQSTLIRQSVFLNNTAGYGGGISLWGYSWSRGELHLVNTTFSGNRAIATVGWNDGGGLFLLYTDLVVENSIFWGNQTVGLGRDAYLDGCSATRRNSCFSPGGVTALNTLTSDYGLIYADPVFEDQAMGDLRLDQASPAIDSGNDLVDYDPQVPGYQALPLLDLDGKWRTVDGDGDGDAVVDMGAYEYQGF